MMWFEHTIALLLFIILFSVLILWIGTTHISLTKSYRLLACSCAYNSFQELFTSEIKQMRAEISYATITNGVLHIITHDGKKVNWYHDGSSLLRILWTTDKSGNSIKQTTMIFPYIQEAVFSIVFDHIHKRISSITGIFKIKLGINVITKRITCYIRKGTMCI